MLVGGFHFATDYGIDVGELARALEARGFESLFLCEHTHIPVSRRSPFPGGGELPKRYSHTHDPFVALSFAAAATRTLKLGTGIALMPQRDPIVTAKSIASLDQLGRSHLRCRRWLERRGDGEPRRATTRASKCCWRVLP
jgi:alkanesulfonate monooxygenase SsuD/methylene tetrahydromethanopterin reductase-like flavin-dependent oxidoreductase (luciferase family)